MPPVRSMLMSTGRFPSGYVGVPGVSPDGMPISPRLSDGEGFVCGLLPWPQDRKSTRLNSSHVKTSYAVFCLKKKKKKQKLYIMQKKKKSKKKMNNKKKRS